MENQHNYSAQADLIIKKLNFKKKAIKEHYARMDKYIKKYFRSISGCSISGFFCSGNIESQRECTVHDLTVQSCWDCGYHQKYINSQTSGLPLFGGIKNCLDTSEGSIFVDVDSGKPKGIIIGNSQLGNTNVCIESVMRHIFNM
jgi:hypothetical protein